MIRSAAMIGLIAIGFMTSCSLDNQSIEDSSDTDAGAMIVTPSAPCLIPTTDNGPYLFLSDRINSFRGHTRDQWQELGRLSQKMATFGEEHEVYQAFQGKEVGDTVNFRSNQFKVVDLGFDD